MIEEMYKEEFGDSSELLSNSNQDSSSNKKNRMNETSQLKHEDTSSSSQQQNHGNNNIPYTSDAEENLIFADPKPDSLMNYNGFGVVDYNGYIGLGNQQDGRFSNPHQLHDFVVWKSFWAFISSRKLAMPVIGFLKRK